MSGWFNYTKEMVSAVEKYSNVIHVLFEDLKLVNRIINVHRRKLTQLNEEKKSFNRTEHRFDDQSIVQENPR